MTIVKPCIYLLSAALAVTPIQVGAQSPRTTPRETPEETVPPPAAGPRILTELEKLRARLGEMVKEAENLAATMKSTVAKTPEQTRGEVRSAAKTLEDLVDRLRPEGDLAEQLKALRGSADSHRTRIANMPSTMVTEGDRGEILKIWDRAIRDADELAPKLPNMRQMVLRALEQLRLREVAISELELAEQHAAALKTLRDWLGELDSAIRSMQGTLGLKRPLS